MNGDGSTGVAIAFHRTVVSIGCWVPGTQHGAMVGNVMVDIGSVGLRLQDDVLSRLLPAEIVLPTRRSSTSRARGRGFWVDCIGHADLWIVEAAGARTVLAIDRVEGGPGIG